MADKEEEKTFEVCFSPVMFPYFKKENAIVVIVDILRATTAMCTAFENGAVKILPIARVEDTYKYKNSGFKIAGERDGIVIPGADFGNSPFNFTKENVKEQSIVITTTNGTQAIDMAKDCRQVIIGSFLNINAVFNYLKAKKKPVTVLCAGWKNKFNMEDSLFAGALATMFCSLPEYNLKCDSAIASMDLWDIAKGDLVSYIQKASHRERLRRLGLDDVIPYCFTLDTCSVIPALENDVLVDISKR